MADAPVHLQVVGIQPETEARKEQVVELLERWLERARSGRYDSILLVGDPAQGDILDVSYSASGDLMGLLGRLERLKHLTLRRMDPEAP